MFAEKRFKAAMALAGINMKELAQALGIDVSTLYRKIPWSVMTVPVRTRPPAFLKPRRW